MIRPLVASIALTAIHTGTWCALSMCLHCYEWHAQFVGKILKGGFCFPSQELKDFIGK